MDDMNAWEARERTYTLWLELGAPIAVDAKEPDLDQRPMPVDADARQTEDDLHVVRDEDRHSTQPAPISPESSAARRGRPHEAHVGRIMVGNNAVLPQDCIVTSVDRM